MKTVHTGLFVFVVLLTRFPWVALAQDARHPAPEAYTSAEREVLNEIAVSVKADPNNAPGVIGRAIATEVPHPVGTSCEIVREGIIAVGKNLTRTLAARIIFSAVKARPEEVLSIVCVAIQQTTDSFDLHIVQAAVAALPNANVLVARANLESDDSKRCGCPPRNDLFDRLPLSDAIYEVALLSGATAFDLSYFPAGGSSGIANDDPINKFPPSTPPPTPPPVSP